MRMRRSWAGRMGCPSRGLNEELGTYGDSRGVRDGK